MKGGALSRATERLRASEPYARLASGFGAVRRCPVPVAAWLAELRREDLGRPVLAVVPRESEALEWVAASRTFGEEIRFFPAPALTPYQATDVSLQVRSAEVVALAEAAAGVGAVTTPRSLFRRLPTPQSLAGRRVDLEVGQEHALERLVTRLQGAGYQRVELVAEFGDMAVRGGLLDCYPPGAEDPVRLDFLGDTLERIQRFDPVTQRSTEGMDGIGILPLALFADDEPRRLAERLEELGGATGAEAARWLAELRTGSPPQGWQRFLPLAAPNVGLEGHLVRPWVVAVRPELLLEEAERYSEALAAEHEARVAAGRVSVDPHRLERSEVRVRELVEGADLVVDGPDRQSIDLGGLPTDLFHGQLPRFPGELETARRRGEEVLVVAPSEQHAWLRDWLDGLDAPGSDVALVSGDLDRGFRLPGAGVAVYGERQLFPRRPVQRRPSRAARSLLAGIRDLQVGDFVVHQDHGIGRFAALRVVGQQSGDEVLPPTLVEAGGDERRGATEVMEVAYQGGRTLLLPLSRLDLIERYSGMDGVAPRLDKLGGNSWSRRKARVKSGMRKLAGDLLRLDAERRVARAPSVPPAGDLYRQFEAAFEHEETPDQETAVEAIEADFARDRPMDRLLCGDVGFGKTEVAMRAAFRAVEAGHRVAVLAPTTILADQHLETFRRRFAGFPVTIDLVSRFRTPAEVRAVRESLTAGTLDIVIGTHRLLSRDIEISGLGLLVVDEEQRFGVAQKERLRSLKKDVHVLSLSATPVPRTLQLSLAGVRDLSVIETPPRDRLAVETVVVPLTTDLVREAVEYELERGGQVYFVHNRVEGIEKVAAWLREVVPRLRLTVGHGQLPERELASRVRAFKAGEHDLLLATTIIENGIDIPTVNTMLIHRADRFGLAQLYQLRGRVGRGRQLGYCYLTVPADRIVSEDARRRLDAIRDFTELGSGFRVAARDLEIRGAGDLLGAEQSGHIAAVGIETYLRMLEETVRELRGEAVEAAPGGVVMDLPVAAGIPVEYVEDANLRMELYRRIAAEGDDPRDLLEELRDRFGSPPSAVEALIRIAATKRLAARLGVQSVSWAAGSLSLRLRRDNRIDLDDLIAWIGGRDDAAFSPSGVLSVQTGAPEALGVALRVLEDLRP